MTESAEPDFEVIPVTDQPSSNSGANSGPKGGFKKGYDPRRATGKSTGRPKDALRAALVGDFEARRHILTAFADNPALSPTERMKAMDLIGKYGPGTQQDNEVKVDRLLIVDDDPSDKNEQVEGG